MKILVIDNKRMLLDVNYIARTFSDGLNKLRTEKWDLLYLSHDLGKNQKSGYDVMVFLKENPHFTPKMIICISDNPSGKDRINGMISDIFGRTFNIQEIMELKRNENEPERI